MDLRAKFAKRQEKVDSNEGATRTTGRPVENVYELEKRMKVEKGQNLRTIYPDSIIIWLELEKQKVAWIIMEQQ